MSKPAPDQDGASPHDDAVSGDRFAVESPRRFRRSWPRLAAVAAVLILLGALISESLLTPPLRVFEIAGTGSVRIEGEEVPVGEREYLESLLLPGVEVRVPLAATLTVVVADTALFELVGGTRMVLPSSFGGWSPRAVQARVDQGEVRFLSGPDFAGRELTIHTPDGLVVVTGTALSVQCDEGGTCVCVLEGAALVGTDEADLEPLLSGGRKVMPRGGPPSISPAAPPHREGVERFVKRVKGRFGR